MKKLVVVLVLLCSSLSIAAKPKLVKAEIQPTEAKSGETVSMAVEFTGPVKKIEYVQVIVREAAYDIDPFYLEKPVKGKAHIWTLQTQVPYDAPVDEFHLEIKAVDTKGNEIVTRECKEQSWGKTGVMVFKVIE